MMSGFSIRLRLWLKLWFRSWFSLCLMLLVPVVMFFLIAEQARGYRPFSSFVYEQFSMVMLTLILQWCFSIDFDSKFLPLLVSYPQRKVLVLLERLLFGYGMFGVIMGLVTVYLVQKMPVNFSFPHALLFALPMYLAVGGMVTLGTVLFRHSLGGLLFGLLYWAISLALGDHAGKYQALILFFPNASLFAAHITEWEWWIKPENEWLVRNRLVFVAAGVVFSGIAVCLFTRQEAV